MSFNYIGVISDSHDRIAPLEAACRIFEDYGVERVVHCGDVVTPETASLFQNYEYLRSVPFDVVWGNNDWKQQELTAEFEKLGPACTCWQGGGNFVWRGKKVFFAHGHESLRLENEMFSGEWDLVLCGHTHQCANELIGKTRVVNPGAVLLGSLCIIDDDLNVEFLEVDR